MCAAIMRLKVEITHSRIADSMIGNESCGTVTGLVCFVPRKVFTDWIANKTACDALVPQEES
jgi:hypothetical protein